MAASYDASASIWEEAEGEFHHEAFLRSNSSDSRSYSSTLESTSAASASIVTAGGEGDECSLDTVIHRPPTAQQRRPRGDATASSRILMAAAARSGSVSSANATGEGNVTGSLLSGSGTGAKGRSARMKAAIQGLGESDEEAEGGDDYWLYGGGGGGGGRNKSRPGGGDDTFLNENVTTPIEAWRKGLRLREAHMPLKCKRRIRRQCQKQPVLKQDHLSILRWKLLVAVHLVCQAWIRLKSFLIDCLLPARLVERKHGRVMFELLFVRKKTVMICLAAALFTAAPSFLSCCGGCVIDYYRNQQAANTTSGVSSSHPSPQFEESLLVDEKSLVFWPLDTLEELAGVHRFSLPDTHLVALALCLCILSIYYGHRAFTLFRQQAMAMDSLSALREALSGWGAGERRAVGARSRRSSRSYANVKARLANNWRKWSVGGLVSAVVVNLFLAAVLVALIYCFVLAEQDFQRGFIRRGGGGPLEYYVISVALFFVFRHVLPALLWSVRDIGYQSPECRANLYAGRVFFLTITFYLVLIFSLLSEFPVLWRGILKRHLYLHAVADVALLALELTLTCCLPRGALGRFLPRLAWLDEFGSHEWTSIHAVDLFIFLVSLSLSQPLAALQLSKLIFTYVTALLVAMCSRAASGGDIFYTSNALLLESCLALAQLVFASIALLFTLLPDITECPLFTMALGNAEGLPKDADRLLGVLLSSGTLLRLIAVLVIGGLFLRYAIRVHCLASDGAYLRRHLEDINQDKNYQVMKQRQWYPFCKCHEVRTRRNPSAAAAAAASSSSSAPSASSRRSNRSNSGAK